MFFKRNSSTLLRLPTSSCRLTAMASYSGVVGYLVFEFDIGAHPTGGSTWVHLLDGPTYPPAARVPCVGACGPAIHRDELWDRVWFDLCCVINIIGTCQGDQLRGGEILQLTQLVLEGGQLTRQWGELLLAHTTTFSNKHNTPNALVLVRCEWSLLQHDVHLSELVLHVRHLLGGAVDIALVVVLELLDLCCECRLQMVILLIGLRHLILLDVDLGDVLTMWSSSQTHTYMHLLSLLSLTFT